MDNLEPFDGYDDSFDILNWVCCLLAVLIAVAVVIGYRYC